MRRFLFDKHVTANSIELAQRNTSGVNIFYSPIISTWSLPTTGHTRCVTHLHRTFNDVVDRVRSNEDAMPHQHSTQRHLSQPTPNQRPINDYPSWPTCCRRWHQPHAGRHLCPAIHHHPGPGRRLQKALRQCSGMPDLEIICGACYDAANPSE